MKTPAWDIELSKKIQGIFSGKMGPSYLDRSWKSFWEQLSARGVWFYLIVMVGLLLVIDGKHRVFIWFLPVVVAFILTLFLQRLIRRPRPKATKTTYGLLFHTYSMPSAHASVSFSFATSLSYAFILSGDPLTGLFVALFYIIALFIALSRVVVGVHYASDVIAGALFGTILTMLLFDF